MILDTLDNRDLYKPFPQLFEALEALHAAMNREFPSERLLVDGDRLYINPISLSTLQKDTPVFEAHRRCIDVHCLFAGEEKLLVQNREKLTLTQPYDEENDYALYQGTAASIITLKPGDFLVCFPQDAHATGLASEKPSAVRKFVAKIQVEEPS